MDREIEDAMKQPYVSLQPGMMAGQPCIGAYRLTVAQFVGGWWEGASLKKIFGSWPYLTRADILVACWYEARYHPRRVHSRAWQKWVEANEGKMYMGGFDDVPMPPQKGEGKC